MAERSIEGTLSGEFLKGNDAPDGRCCFRANDNSFVVLCYFKDGRKLKGPHLKFLPSKKLVEIRSKTWIDNGHQVCTLAVVKGQNGQMYNGKYRTIQDRSERTDYFVDKKLVKSVPRAERHTFDWILADRQPKQQSEIKFELESIGSFNKYNSNDDRSILFFYPLSEIQIGDWEKGNRAHGTNFLHIGVKGRIVVGQWQKKGRKISDISTTYENDGTISESEYSPEMAVFAN